MATAAGLSKDLRALVDPEKAVFLPRFFKTGQGEYAEGDKFLGVTVPNTRLAIKPYVHMPLAEARKLLTSPWHEERLAALFILVAQFKRASEANKRAIYDLYMVHTKFINNWDLVDSSAGYIVGGYLDGRPEKMEVLERLAASELLWRRRIAMIATYCYIMQGRADEALIIAEKLLYDKHDLIQKAVGWMLREIGKRVDHRLLAQFLDRYAATMPRTTLRYALEHFTPERKLYYMQAARQHVK